MDIFIRPARREDLAALLHLYVHLNPENASLPDEGHLRQVWDQLLSDPKMDCFVAEMGSDLVASCTLVTVPNLTRRARPYGLIENVVTHADHRRQGIGTWLLRHALDVAWSLDCYKVMLLTGSHREETLRFYERVGFKRGLKTGFVMSNPGLVRERPDPVHPGADCAPHFRSQSTET